MRLSDTDFRLPDELIAQRPTDRRDASRMLIVNRQTAAILDHQFVDICEFLRPGDLLVLNNTKVFPARLLGRSSTGAKVEIFLISSDESGRWTALARPARRLHVGKRIDFDGKLAGEVLEKLPDGRILIGFDECTDLFATLDEIGKTPLPPYIKRDHSVGDTDRDRYQTVFAKNRGAIAAPTAGLHFTQEVLEKVRAIGADIAEITLHVGYGTFEPVRVEQLSDHRVSAENYDIPHETAALLNLAKSEGRRIIAVGTTTTRTLESNIAEFGAFTPGSYLADLTITPGSEFRAIDGLLTNFHLPQSSLLVLTSTFGGHELIMDAYRHAVAKKYRFYSYGDCMLIV